MRDRPTIDVLSDWIFFFSSLELMIGLWVPLANNETARYCESRFIGAVVFVIGAPQEVRRVKGLKL